MSESEKPQKPTPFQMARIALHWLGVQNEHGLFSWRLALLAVGIIAVLKHPGWSTAGVAVAALVVHLWEGARSQQRTRFAMETAAKQAKEKLEWEGRLALEQVKAQVEKMKIDAEMERAKMHSERLKELEEFRKKLDSLKIQVDSLSKTANFAQLQESLAQRLGVRRPTGSGSPPSSG